MTRKLWAIVRREYLERVRSKAFIVGTLLAPALMSGLMIVPLLMAKQQGKRLRVAVLDASGTLQAAAEQVLRRASFEDKPRFEVVAPPPGSAEAREAALKQEMLAGRLDGYLLLPVEAVEKLEASYVGRSVSNRIDLRTMEDALGDLLLGQRLRGAGLDPVRVKELTRKLDLKTLRLSATGEREEGSNAVMASIILLMILYVSILMWGQMVMTGVIEEKGSRVIEVIASGVSPGTLMTGKLLGIGAAGFTQFAVWSLSLFLLSAAGSGAMIGSFAMPELSPLVLVSFVAFFVLGFVLYASLYAAIGAAVNTVQEAQNLAFPVLLPLIVGMVSFPVILESPDSALAVGLSMFPLLTPLLMFLRIVVLTPPWWQIALSVLLLLLTIWGVIWFSSRIYRVGILMYGKKPTFPELMRWVRHT